MSISVSAVFLQQNYLSGETFIFKITGCQKRLWAHMNWLKFY